MLEDRTVPTCNPFPCSGGNQPPEITVPGPQALNEDTDLFIAGISITDSDAGSADVQVILSVQNGALTVDTAVDLGVDIDDVIGNCTGTVTITAPLDAINATLADDEGLKYRGDLDFYGLETLSIDADDLGNTGTDGPKTDSDSVDIYVHALFDPGENLVVDEDAGPQLMPGWAQGLSVTNNDHPEWFAAGPAIDPATGDLTYETALNANGVATITLDTSDTFTITVNPINDAPSFTAANPPPVGEGASAVSVPGWATFSPGGGSDESTQTATYLYGRQHRQSQRVQRGAHGKQRRHAGLQRGGQHDRHVNV
jgi:hypothetical protein